MNGKYIKVKFALLILSIFLFGINCQAAGDTFGGVGMILYKEPINKKLIIRDIIPNSPAESMRIPIGGVIQKINGEKTKKLSIAESTSLIRGEIGTNVDLVIKYNGKTNTYSIKRAKISMPKENIDERYMLHWKQVVPDGLEYVKFVHSDVIKVLSKSGKEDAYVMNYWATREVGFKKGYDACMSYPKNEQNSCLMNLVNREIAQTENDRQAELQEAMIEQQANQNYINNMNQIRMNNSLQDINNSIRSNNNNLNNINNSIRDTNFYLNNINSKLRRW